MTSKVKSPLPLLLPVLFILTMNNNVTGQNVFNSIARKVENKINKKVDELLEPRKKKKGGKKNDSNRPLLSELRDEDFIQNDKNPERDSNDTRYSIAKNLAIDIKGIYPNGYRPKWRFIHYASSLSFTRENWLFPSANTYQDQIPLSIGEYDGKAVIRIDAHANCDCFADIIVKDSFSVITEKPQTYEIKNFRKILNNRSTGEPCRGGNNWHVGGGWAGKVTLSANSNGNIIMDMMLENYSQDYENYKEIQPSQVSMRYVATNISIENEMSAEKANGIIAAEVAAKQRQKGYIIKTKKQSDSLQKLIAKKYPQANCRDCFYSSNGSYISTTTVDQYYVRSGAYAGSRTDWDLNIKTTIRNKCSYNLLFIGIQQFHNEERGYYLKEVTKIMPANYSYNMDQDVMTSAFISLLGGGSEFNFKLQDKYYPDYASLGSVQWIKVIKTK